MRSNAFLIFLAPVIFLRLTAIPTAGQAVDVVDWSSEWRYYQGGRLPASNWASTNYSDADWASGPGVFGVPSDEMLRIPDLQITTPLSLTVNGSNIITYYFRTRFDLASTNRLLLVASNLIDDGAVIYLNGREVRRLSMPPGGIAYPTLATRSDDISTHGVETFEIALTNAVVGRNVLAVELHQGNSLSADVVFGMKLTAEVLQPPVILREPQDITVEEGKRGSFNVQAIGSPPLSYRWYYTAPPGTNLVGAGATATIFTPLPTVAMDGRQYLCVVANSVGSVTSRVATLTVIPDILGPRMLSATRRQANQIDLRWDEPTTREPAQAVSNYTVRSVGTTNTLEVTNVLWGTDQTRLLLAQNLDDSVDYVVCARNISDTRTNRTASDCIALTVMVSTTPVPLASSWNFATPFTEAPATNWTHVDYVLEDFWGEGLAMFAHETTQGFNPPCTIFQTQLPVGLNAYYFRRTFTFPSDLGPEFTATLRYALDDGAVFYLNGAELLRVRMPPWPTVITKGTLATMSADARCETSSIEISPDLLRVGSNVLTVEVHQVADEVSQNDVAFDAELTFIYPRARRHPELTITSTRDVNGQVTAIQAAWSDNAWELETATNVNGPWMIQPANGTLFQAPPSADRKFFRLKGP